MFGSLLPNSWGYVLGSNEGFLKTPGTERKQHLDSFDHSVNELYKISCCSSMQQTLRFEELDTALINNITFSFSCQSTDYTDHPGHYLRYGKQNCLAWRLISEHDVMLINK